MLTFLSPPLPHRVHRRPPPRCRARVPSDATTAANDIQASVRSALLSGRRRLCVDILTAAVDVRAPTYDPSAASTVLLALINALLPILPSEQPTIRVIAPSPSAALRFNSWLRDAQMSNISVGVLGVDDTHDASAYIVVNPDGNPDTVMELRRVLKHAVINEVPTIVHNHPRQDVIYSLLGFGGHIPFELTKFEDAFVLAPFAVNPRNEGDGPTKRFVVLRKYPDSWALWRFVGEAQRAQPPFSEAAPKEVQDPFELERVNEYTLVQEFATRPTDGEIMHVIETTLPY